MLRGIYSCVSQGSGSFSANASNCYSCNCTAVISYSEMRQLSKMGRGEADVMYAAHHQESIGLYSMFLTHESRPCFETFPSWFIQVGLLGNHSKTLMRKKALLNQKSISLEFFALNYWVGYGEDMSFGVRLGRLAYLVQKNSWFSIIETTGHHWVHCQINVRSFFGIMGCQTNSLWVQWCIFWTIVVLE